MLENEMKEKLGNREAALAKAQKAKVDLKAQNFTNMNTECNIDDIYNTKFSI